jgi:hypothetical protein
MMLGRFIGVATGGPNLLVDIDDAGHRVSLRFADGCLLTASSTRGKADLSLRSPESGLLAALAGLPLPRPEVVEAAIPGRLFAPIAPFDVGPQGADAERIVGVDVVVQHAQYDSPIGDLLVVDHFQDGMLVARTPGRISRPDATVRNNYANAIASNTPTTPILEAINGAHVTARDPAMLMVIAALYDAAPLRRHLDQRRAVSNRLCALAAHTRSTSWKQM